MASPALELAIAVNRATAAAAGREAILHMQARMLIEAVRMIGVAVDLRADFHGTAIPVEVALARTIADYVEEIGCLGPG